MSEQKFSPGPTERTVRAARGEVMTVPESWELLPPGDAALTRRVKAAGEHWLVQEKKGRRTFSKGVWAPSETISRIRSEVDQMRSTESYSKQRASQARRREKVQQEYVGDFAEAIVQVLGFHQRHDAVARRLADVVTRHATPVGSGTVARTKRIPIERRAEAAVIAWMRHQTTAYDSMEIPRVKGKRREVRRMLAARSKQLLSGYRRGEAIGPSCPLKRALDKPTSGGAEN